MQHQKGDYLQTIKYLEHLQEGRQGEDNADLLKLMLIEAYLGVTIHDFQTLRAKVAQIGEGVSAE